MDSAFATLKQWFGGGRNFGVQARIWVCGRGIERFSYVNLSSYIYARCKTGVFPLKSR